MKYCAKARKLEECSTEGRNTVIEYKTQCCNLRNFLFIYNECLYRIKTCQ